ncbi:MAG TPA: hypothetical protein VGH19_20510 [Verrucomicrobiae bacterium]
MKNLIIGLVSGYDFAALRPFFDTLAATGYAGDVLLFHDRTSEETLNELKKRGVKLIAFKQRYPRHPLHDRKLNGEGKIGSALSLTQRTLQLLPGSEQSITALGRRLYHVVNIRFLLTDELLQRGQLSEYGRIMLTDVRDVVFQRDPFSFDDGGEVTSFWEHPRFTMETDKNYRDWITKAFGKDYAQKHFKDRISCCAITMGPTEKMKTYFREFVKFLLVNKTAEPFRFGLDSAIHNRLIWEGRIPGLRMLENLHGPVVHLGGIKAEEIIRSSNNEILNQDGSPIAVLHQYDRHADILTQYGGHSKKKKSA